MTTFMLPRSSRFCEQRQNQNLCFKRRCRNDYRVNANDIQIGKMRYDIGITYDQEVSDDGTQRTRPKCAGSSSRNFPIRNWPSFSKIN